MPSSDEAAAHTKYLKLLISNGAGDRGRRTEFGIARKNCAAAPPQKAICLSRGSASQQASPVACSFPPVRRRGHRQLPTRHHCGRDLVAQPATTNASRRARRPWLSDETSCGVPTVRRQAPVAQAPWSEGTDGSDGRVSEVGRSSGLDAEGGVEVAAVVRRWYSHRLVVGRSVHRTLTDAAPSLRFNRQPPP